METVDVLMKMPKIDGYEYTGEYRIVESRELCFYHGNAKKWETGCSSMFHYPILRKAQVWKRLTLEKALEFGKTRVLRRFRCSEGVNAPPGPEFTSTVDYIDLKAPSNVRLSEYGWRNSDFLEYLED